MSRNIQQEYQQTIDKVKMMPSDHNATQLAGRYGLNLTSVTWEDNARSKNSSWGPCISDMTLSVEGRDLPLLRPPNYQDLTWDVEIDKIPLVVGNAKDEMLCTVTLKEYLKNYRDYLSFPDWNTPHTSLLAPRDTHVLMSSQACFLPVPAEGGESKFNVSLRNYTSRPGHPAVLVIVANERGSSAQIIENEGGPQKLYFNKNGERCSFLGQRLSQHRIEEGREQDLGKPMSEEEKQKNMLLIIQIPLVVAPPTLRRFKFAPVMCAMKCNSAAPMMMDLACDDDCDVEDAIVKVGEAEGAFKELGGLKVERNPDYPVRVTMQFYKATSNGLIGEKEMAAIATQLRESRKYATSVGSLVVGGNSNRPTEPSLPSHSFPCLPPPWWSEFWLTYGSLFPQWNSETASKQVFSNGRFKNSTMDACQDQVLDILGKSPSPSQFKVEQKAPVWGVL
eukprot:TRINITY_DN1983_c0_g1_i1.p1 TRINITY_DN1983_c0_g1~~TRINITY_DN1983_c0_g1_i1.p1  ORF type:complete len:449 (-),score=76.68 TRINITY_DN1983_c0_g1_i1:56-1402(-)